MQKTFRVVVLVLGGLVGGYIGYWLGYWAGWSTNAEWPLRIGGGNGAIALSMGMAVVGVLVAGAFLRLPSWLIDRRLRNHGEHAEATIVDRWGTGLSMRGLSSSLKQYRVLVEVRLPDGTHRKAHSTQWLQPDEFSALQPGRQVTVHYHLRHPDRVLIDTAHLAPIR
ncbi:MAG: DUF3592 domain-containing protein [Actinomycetes bacterium]